MSAAPCTRPPEGWWCSLDEGWWCSLDEGHEGPCPTHPYYGTPLETVLKVYLSPQQIAQVRADLRARITPEMAARQEAALKRIRERNARWRAENGFPPDPLDGIGPDGGAPR